MHASKRWCHAQLFSSLVLVLSVSTIRMYETTIDHDHVYLEACMLAILEDKLHIPNRVDSNDREDILMSKLSHHICFMDLEIMCMHSLVLIKYEE